MNEEFYKYTYVTTSFQYPEIKDTDYKFGSGKLQGTPLREDGDWRDYTPPPEEQRRHGVESSSCFGQAHQKAISTILEEQFLIPDQNFSERFTIIHSDASRFGGSPINSANSIRHDGLIPDEMLPFSEDIDSWDEFNSYSGGDEIACVKRGREWLKTWSPAYDIVFERHETIEEKYAKLRAALRYSPVCLSVFAWAKNADGEYVKPPKEGDNHFVTAVYVDDQNCVYVWDTYGPDFLKKLAPNYNFEFAMRWSIEKRELIPSKPNWFIDLIKRILKLFI